MGRGRVLNVRMIKKDESLGYYLTPPGPRASGDGSTLNVGKNAAVHVFVPYMITFKDHDFYRGRDTILFGGIPDVLHVFVFIHP